MCALNEKRPIMIIHRTWLLLVGTVVFGMPAHAEDCWMHHRSSGRLQAVDREVAGRCFATPALYASTLMAAANDQGAMPQHGKDGFSNWFSYEPVVHAAPMNCSVPASLQVGAFFYCGYRYKEHFHRAATGESGALPVDQEGFWFGARLVAICPKGQMWVAQPGACRLVDEPLPASASGPPKRRRGS